MYNGLIRTLAYMYQFISLGRGKMTAQELADGTGWARVLAGKAPDVIEPEGGDDPTETKLDLAQAELIEQHIEEMVAWINAQEIV